MTYEPTPIDLIWAKQTLDIVKEGGVWIAPASGNTYLVNHKYKSLTRTATADPEDNHKVHERSKVVFGQLGYIVKDLDKGAE